MHCSRLRVAIRRRPISPPIRTITRSPRFIRGNELRPRKNRVDQFNGVTLGMVSPDGRLRMVEHAEQFAAAGIPFIFDPGQGMPMFDGRDLALS